MKLLKNQKGLNICITNSKHLLQILTLAQWGRGVVIAFAKHPLFNKDF